MTDSRANYGIIQFVPSDIRDERINVGLIVVAGSEMRIRVIRYERIKVVFGFNNHQLRWAMTHIKNAEKDLKRAWKSGLLNAPHGLYGYRSNHRTQMVRRRCRVNCINTDFERMFAELVEINHNERMP